VTGRRYRLFGLDVESEIELDGLPPREPAGAPDLRIRLAPRDRVEAAFSGPADPPAAWGTVIDGAPYSVERGRGGDLRLSWGGTSFQLAAGAGDLACAPEDPAAAGWRRVLLDSVLAAVVMERGDDVLHAGAVSGSDGVVAVIAATGGGKTTLTAELVRRGRPLVTDDLLVVRPSADGPLAVPGPPLMNLPAGAAGAGELGRTLARLGDELWIAVARAVAEPRPLAAVVLLDRSAGPVSLEPLPSSHLLLMANALRSGNDPRRRARRFDTIADVAQSVPALHLRAAADTTPAVLANALEPALAGRATLGAAR
jgi:hypothetical protein